MTEGVWSDGTLVLGYLARPASGKPRAGIVVCPGSDGATAILEEVARGLAKAGYAALLVDRLSRAGGTAAVPEGGRGAVLATPGAAAQRVADLWGAAAPQRSATRGCGPGASAS